MVGLGPRVSLISHSKNFGKLKITLIATTGMVYLKAIRQFGPPKKAGKYSFYFSYLILSHNLLILSVD